MSFPAQLNPNHKHTMETILKEILETLKKLEQSVTSFVQRTEREAKADAEEAQRFLDATKGSH